LTRFKICPCAGTLAIATKRAATKIEFKKNIFISWRLNELSGKRRQLPNDCIGKKSHY